MFIAFSQTVITALVCYVKKKLSNYFPNKFSFPDIDVCSKGTIIAVSAYLNYFSGLVELIINLFQIFPLSLLFTAMITTNNLCLKYASVAYYYIGRSLTTIFNVTFTYLILGEKTTTKCILCCAVIVFGFWLGVDQEHLAGKLIYFL